MSVISPSASLASSSSLIRARATSFSLPLSRIRVTPWVLRPMTEMPATGIRITWPWSVISITSVSSSTWTVRTTGPLRPRVLMLIRPMPPRPWIRYSLASVRLPKPFSVTVSRVESGVMMSSPTTRSSPTKVMPLTPAAVRPISRTSSPRKRIALPSRVHIRTSSPGSIRRAVSTESPSLSPQAMIPVERTWL